MAIKQVLIDDLDGREGVRTRSFSLGNTAYAIDLTDENHVKLEKALEPFIDVARRKGAKPKVKTVGAKAADTTPSNASDLAAIRDWARKNNATSRDGKKVTDRGRIPKDIVDQFN